jgi:hypothetical protein
MPADNSQEPVKIKNNTIVSGSIHYSRLKFWHTWSKRTRIIFVIIVAIILIIVFISVFLIINRKPKETSINDPSQLTAAKVVSNLDNYDDKAVGNYIKDTLNDPKYAAGQNVNLAKVKSFDDAYALAIAFDEVNDYKNSLAAYALAETKLNLSDKMNAYIFYRDYGGTAGAADQKQLAIDKFTRAKELFIDTDVAKKDPIFKNQTVEYLDDIIKALKEANK